MFKTMNPKNFSSDWVASPEKIASLVDKKAEKQVAKQANKVLHSERVGLPFTVECANPNCSAVLGYVHENLQSEQIAVKAAGWRQFRFGMILCPVCREIQERRVKAEFNRKMWAARQQYQGYGEDYVDPLA